MADKKGIVVVLNEYFQKPCKTDLTSPHRQTTMKEFAAELKELTAEEKLELAQQAAVELGYTQDDVKFPME